MTSPVTASNDEAPASAQEGGAIERPRKTGFLAALVITTLVQAVVVAAVLAPTVIAPAVAAALRLPDSAVGIYMSIVYLSAIGSALYSSTPISKFGAIRMSQAGLISCAVGVALVATGNIWLGLLGAVMLGLGYGPITPASSHILIRTTPPHRLSIVFSIKQTGVPLGGVLVGLLIPPQEAAYGWAWALLSASVGCIAMIAVAAWVRKAFDDDLTTPLKQSFVSTILNPIRLVTSQRPLRVLSACSFVFAGVQLSLITYLSTYLNLSLGWSLLAAGVAVSVTQTAGMAGRVIWGAIADAGAGAQRMLTVLTTMMIASCIGIGMFAADTPRVWVFAVLTMFGASAVGWNGIFLAQVARLAPPGKASLATGGTLAFSFFGTVFWAPLFGLLVDAIGSYQVCFLLFCFPLLICLGYLAKGRLS